MNTTLNATNNLFGDLGLNLQTGQQTTDKGQLGQADFLKLMIAQIQHQDPLEPESNGDFIAQLAQFSTVDGINNLNTSFNSLNTALTSNQALQASSLVGRSVLVPSDNAVLAVGERVEGAVDLPSNVQDLKITITDEAGQIVNVVMVGSQRAGQFDFIWDGQGASGNILPPGRYSFNATATINGEPQALNTLISDRVSSVSLGQGSNGLTLNLANHDGVPLSQIRQIGL